MRQYWVVDYHEEGLPEAVKEGIQTMWESFDNRSNGTYISGEYFDSEQMLDDLGLEDPEDRQEEAENDFGIREVIAVEAWLSEKGLNKEDVLFHFWW